MSSTFGNAANRLTHVHGLWRPNHNMPSLGIPDAILLSSDMLGAFILVPVRKNVVQCRPRLALPCPWLPLRFALKHLSHRQTATTHNTKTKRKEKKRKPTKRLVLLKDGSTGIGIGLESHHTDARAGKSTFGFAQLDKMNVLALKRNDGLRTNLNTCWANELQQTLEFLCNLRHMDCQKQHLHQHTKHMELQSLSCISRRSIQMLCAKVRC